LIDGAAGVWHVANGGALSWMAFARMAAAAAGLDPDAIEPGHSPSPARRPPFSALGSERGAALPPLEDGLSRYVRDRRRIGDAA
jgi:dTDP-4-dehydrorhamnose reductase